jgi:hypothetical protein
MSYSTSKILERLALTGQSQAVVPETSQSDEIYDAPQLKLSATNVNEMQNALTNALGLSNTKKLSPTD